MPPTTRLRAHFYTHFHAHVCSVRVSRQLSIHLSIQMSTRMPMCIPARMLAHIPAHLYAHVCSTFFLKNVSIIHLPARVNAHIDTDAHTSARTPACPHAYQHTRRLTCLLRSHALYRLYVGVADGMSIARAWACRYPK